MHSSYARVIIINEISVTGSLMYVNIESRWCNHGMLYYTQVYIIYLYTLFHSAIITSNIVTLIQSNECKMK